MAAAPELLKAAALNLVPYPEKKQSSAQQAKDDSECYDWTKQSTGIDLSAPVAAQDTSGQQQPQKGTRARGAAAGAIAGEVLDDKGGEGAAVGAAAGAARSGKKQKEQAAQAQAESESAAQSAQAQRLETFRKG